MQQTGLNPFITLMDSDTTTVRNNALRPTEACKNIAGDLGLGNTIMPGALTASKTSGL